MPTILGVSFPSSGWLVGGIVGGVHILLPGRITGGSAIAVRLIWIIIDVGYYKASIALSLSQISANLSVPTANATNCFCNYSAPMRVRWA